jgi:hypothetical protein
MRKNTKDDFWKKVDKSGDCWLWTGSIRNKKGYGEFRIAGKRISAHRFSYELKNGFIKESEIICHTCDTPLCVNPDHLFSGTHKDNCDDKIRKGRLVVAKGSDQGNAKISENTIKRIRIVGNAITQQRIADIIGIDRSNVGYILRRKTWSHIV